MVEHWDKCGIPQLDKKIEKEWLQHLEYTRWYLYCFSHNKTKLVGVKKTDSDEVSTWCLGLGKELFK